MRSRKTLFALEYEIRKLLSDNDFISEDGESGKQWYDNLVSDLAHLTEQEIEKAREEGRRETLLEMQREFSEYEVPDDVRYTHPLFYINNIIEEKLSKLTTK